MRIFSYIVLGIFLSQSTAHGFEIVNRQKSFENNRFFSLQLGLGMSELAHTEGVSKANPGFVVQTALAHRINQYLEAQVIYQFSTFRFNSPDPITPATTTMQTRTGLHQELFLLKAFYPAVVAQPYITAGFGGYQFFGVASETALSFPASYEVPVGAGVQTFISGNSISLDFQFLYHFMFGQSQDATTLSILSLKSVSFNMYSIVGGFTFHFL